MRNVKATLMMLVFVLTGPTAMAAVCFKDAAGYEAAKQQGGLPAVLSELPVSFKRSAAKPLPAAATQIYASNGRLYMDGHQVSAFNGKYESDRAIITNVCIENGVAKISLTDLATKKSYTKNVRIENNSNVSVPVLGMGNAWLSKTSIQDYERVVAGFKGTGRGASGQNVALGSR